MIRLERFPSIRLVPTSACGDALIVGLGCQGSMTRDKSFCLVMVPVFSQV